MNKINQQKGNAILYAVLMVTLMLGMTIVLSAVFISKIKAATESSYSLKAIYAADSGLEGRLYQKRVDAEASLPSMSNETIFTVYDGTSTIRSVGEYKGVKRALEIGEYE